jgi:methionine aminopeptidase
MLLLRIQYVHKHARKNVTTAIQTILNNQNTPQKTIKEIENMTHDVLRRNSFKCNNDCCKQEGGLAIAS